jgi:succinate dehydrogenase flavin-adding protein (antitoxin of CptAB toxin-antitoxin module)
MILGLICREIDWVVNRFAKLNGDAISKEEIKEMLKILA